jgi:division protein 1
LTVILTPLQSLINSEITEITNKIEALDTIRAKLEQDLLKLQEDELELDDECELVLLSVKHLLFNRHLVVGVKERLEFEQSTSRIQNTPAQPLHLPPSSRRRKGTQIVLLLPFYYFNLIIRASIPPL